MRQASGMLQMFCSRKVIKLHAYNMCTFCMYILIKNAENKIRIIFLCFVSYLSYLKVLGGWVWVIITENKWLFAFLNISIVSYLKDFYLVQIWVYHFWGTISLTLTVFFVVVVIWHSLYTFLHNNLYLIS